MIISVPVFALMLIVAIIGYSRSMALYSLWENVVQEGKLHKMSQEDLLRPWLVRVYQRARTYKNFANILMSISAVVVAQILYRSTPLDEYSVRAATAIFRLASISLTAIMLLNSVFSTQLGLRSEVRALRKLLPKYNIQLDDLIKLHESEKYFSTKDLQRK